jgi:hypothetical protein
MGNSDHFASLVMTVWTLLLGEYNNAMPMEKLYDVVTLADCMQDPATVAWLVQSGLTLPDIIPSGRYPTSEEMRNMIDGIPGITVDYLISDSVWEATVRSRKDVSWAILTLHNYQSQDDAPHHFYFKAGWDEMIELVTVKLARQCGPFVLLPNSGAAPKILM